MGSFRGVFIESYNNDIFYRILLFLNDFDDVRNLAATCKDVLNLIRGDSRLRKVGHLLFRGRQDGLPLLHAACKYHEFYIARFLVRELNHDAENAVEIIDGRRSTPISEAVKSGSLRIFDFLIERRDKPLKEDESVLDAAMESLERGKMELPMARRLLSLGVKPPDSLHIAAEKGHSELVKMLVEEFKMDINGENGDGRTALMIACREQHNGIVDYLLEKSADCRLGDVKQGTALHFAAQADNYGAMIKIIDEGRALVDVADSELVTPFHLALQNASIASVRYLLAMGSDVHRSDVHGFSCLHYATLSKRLEKVKMLVEEYNVNPLGNTTVLDENCLHFAARFGLADIAAYFIQRGIDANASNTGGETPLHCASSNGHLETVEILLTEGQAEVEVEDERGVTPLMQAAFNGHNKVISLLLKRGADANKSGQEMLSPLFQAIHGKNAEGMKILLLEGKADVNLRKCKKSDYKGMELKIEETALLVAAELGFEEGVKVLIEVGNADKSVGYKLSCIAFVSYTQTPIDVADEKNHPRIVLYLLSKGARLLQMGFDKGPKLLRLAAKTGFTEAISPILKEFSGVLRSDVLNCTDGSGRSPLWIASSNGHAEFVRELLFDWKADPNLGDEDGKTALHVAVAEGHEEVIDLLLDCSAGKVNARDRRLRSPLLWACENGNLNIVKKLLEKGAKIELTDHERRNCLHLAASKANLDIFRVLLQQNGAKLLLDQKDVKARTALNEVCRIQRPASPLKLIYAAVKLQIELNQVDLSHKDAVALLTFCANNGHVDLIRMLANECQVKLKKKSLGQFISKVLFK